MTTAKPESTVADFVKDLTWDILPSEARHRVVDLLLDSIACAYQGRAAEAFESWSEFARAHAGGGDSLVIADSPASPAAAALLNGWMVTATTMCDVYRPRMCHVTPVVLPAVLAGSSDATTRSELLTAFAAGVEVTVRLCDAMSADRFQGARWHAPGVVGPYGAATAYSKLRHDDVGTIRSVWGAAGQQSAGSFAAIGSPSVKVNQARGAMAGIMAAQLAVAGHGGHPDPWSHPDGGLFEAYGAGDVSAITEGLGQRWMLLDVSLRRWSASSSLQTVIETIIELATDTAPTHIQVMLPPQSHKLCANIGWDDQLSSLQSAAWVAAVAWLDRACGPEQFSEHRRRDVLAHELAQSIEVTVDPLLPEGAARVHVVRHDGSTGESMRDAMAGSPHRPLSRADILEKLTQSCGTERAHAIEAAILGDGDISSLRGVLASQL